MSAGRVVGTLISCAAVAGCAAVVVGMARAESPPRRDSRAAAADTAPLTTRALPAQHHLTPIFTRPSTSAPAASVASSAPPLSSAPPSFAPPSSAPRTSVPAAPATTAPRPAPVGTTPSTSRTTATPQAVPAAPARRSTVARPAARPVTHAAPKPVHRSAAKPVQHAAARPAGSTLPLKYGTGSATRVVTVTAGSSRSTRATLQAWTKLSNGRWKKYGSSVRAYVGRSGIGKASESSSKTPRGSWTLTSAFGRKANPGTTLPYTRTTPSDYWISSPGKRYNTRQRCGSCGYNNGVNERLYYVNPEYNYAAVIDYNTRNAPGGVKAGKGSAFFLHVSAGQPTAGCVAIPQSRLTSLLRWLSPGTHPRILIGVT